METLSINQINLEPARQLAVALCNLVNSARVSQNAWPVVKGDTFN